MKIKVKKTEKKPLRKIDLGAIGTITIKDALAVNTDALIAMQEAGESMKLAVLYKTLAPSPQRRAVRQANLIKDMLKTMGYALSEGKAPGRVASPRKKKVVEEPEEELTPVEDDLTDDEKVDAIKDVKAGKEKAVKAKPRSKPRVKKRVAPNPKEMFPRNIEVGGRELVRVDLTTHKEFARLVFGSHLYGTFIVMQEDGMQGLSHFLALFTNQVATVLADFPADDGTIMNVLTERLDFKKGEMVTVEASSTPLVEPFAVYVVKEEDGGE